MRASSRFIARTRESLFQGAQSILASTGRPVTLHPLSKGRGAIACFSEPWSYTVTGCHKSANLTNCQFRIILEREQEQLLAETKSEILRGRTLPKIICVIWTDKLILKQWKLGILEQGMNSPDENKLYSTKSWQIEKELRDSLVRSIQKLEELKRAGMSTRRIFDKNVRRKSFERCRICTQWTIISLSNSTSVISSSLWTRRIAEARLKFAAKYMGYARFFGKRFLQIHKRLLRQLFCSTQVISLLREIFRCKQIRGNP